MSKEKEEYIQNIILAIALIREKHGIKKPIKDIQGEIECPICKNRLWYSISSFNNHVWGKCKMENCLSWMM